MSERGSFTTEYIYCYKCRAAARSILLKPADSSLCTCEIPSWESDRRPWWQRLFKREIKTLPIIAGKIGGIYAGEELDVIEHDLGPKLCELICHPLRIAVVAEDGEYIFRLEPGRIANPRSQVGWEKPPVIDKTPEIQHRQLKPE